MDAAELTTGRWLVAGLAAVLLGLSKTGIAGLGLVGIAVAALALPARPSLGVILLLLILGDLVALALYRRKAQWRLLLRLLPGTIAGLVIGTLVLGMLDPQATQVLIGTLLVGLVGVTCWRMTIRSSVVASDPPAASPVAAWATGALAGFTTMTANAAGPLMTLYLLAMGLTKQDFLGTAAWFFLVVNLTKLPSVVGLGLIDPDSLVVTSVLCLPLLVGCAAGRWLLPRIDHRLFDIVALTCTGLAALMLIF